MHYYFFRPDIEICCSLSQQNTSFAENVHVWSSKKNKLVTLVFWLVMFVVWFMSLQQMIKMIFRTFYFLLLLYNFSYFLPVNFASRNHITTVLLWTWFWLPLFPSPFLNSFLSFDFGSDLTLYIPQFSLTFSFCPLFYLFYSHPCFKFLTFYFFSLKWSSCNIHIKYKESKTSCQIN